MRECNLKEDPKMFCAFFAAGVVPRVARMTGGSHGDLGVRIVGAEACFQVLCVAVDR